MNTPPNLILALLATSILLACAGTPATVQSSSSQPEATMDAQQPPTPSPNVAGRYVNENGEITLTDVEDGKGFQYRIQLGVPEACAGVDYTGQATFISSSAAQGVGDDTFAFEASGLKAEPDITHIGMSCAQVIDLLFVKH